jgi:protein ImuB
MFVWLPNFAITLARLKNPALAKPSEPLALLEKHGNIRRIAALDEPAVRAGLHLHQPLADALAIYPKLILADSSPETCKEALEALAIWAQRYSPATAPAHPSGLWLDVTGCAHLWGREAELSDDLIGRLKARGILARAAIAPTFGAAYALAHHAEHYVIAGENAGAVRPPHPNPLPNGRGNQPTDIANAFALTDVEKALSPREGWVRGALELSPNKDTQVNLADLLAPLPIERMRVSSGTASLLKKLGLFTIGDVQKLPRAGLARRCPDLLPQLDKALGRVQEAIDFIRPPTPWIERLPFAEPISAPEDLERMAARLLEMLCRRLEAERQGGLSFEVSFFRSDGGVQSQSVSTALPVRDPVRVMRLFREKLGFIDPGFGIDLAMISALKVEPLENDQRSILQSENSAACMEELAALIDALENRLGKGRVYRLGPVESYIPERAIKKIGPIPSPQPSPHGRGSRPRPLQRRSLSLRERDRVRGDNPAWKSIGERPIRLFSPPQPIDATATLPDAPPLFFRWRKILHRIGLAEGPERISPEWWLGGDPDEDAKVRDYYRVESLAGMRFWIFREGTYGAGRMPRWFLHGLFP